MFWFLVLNKTHNDMNYEKDMNIEEDALEQEWLDQASLANKYGRYWSECRQTLTLAEENIKLVRAELVKEANEDPDEYLGDGVKPTGGNIESYYRNHDRHKEAKQEWVEALFEANVAEIAYKEISFTRKAALENLVKLFQSDYFAGPSVPRNITEERELKKKDLNKRVGAKLKRRN